jgi:WD40 repeat protein
LESEEEKGVKFFFGPRALFASAGAETIIRVWDLASGLLLRSLGGHLARVNALSMWEGYQSLVISDSADRTLRVCDLLTGKCVSIMIRHTDDILTATCTTPDGNDGKMQAVLIFSSADLSVVCWDLFAILQDHYFISNDEKEWKSPPLFACIAVLRSP